jgi:hypothetical protein
MDLVAVFEIREVGYLPDFCFIGYDLNINQQKYSNSFLPSEVKNLEVHVESKVYWYQRLIFQQEC